MEFYVAATHVIERAGLSDRKGNSVQERTQSDLEAHPPPGDTGGGSATGVRESLAPSDPTI